jgi:hypothetical protein
MAEENGSANPEVHDQAPAPSAPEETQSPEVLRDAGAAATAAGVALKSAATALEKGEKAAREKRMLNAEARERQKDDRDAKDKTASQAPAAPAAPAPPPSVSPLISAKEIMSYFPEDKRSSLKWRIYRLASGQTPEFLDDIDFSADLDLERTLADRFKEGMYRANLVIGGRHATAETLSAILRPEDRHLAPVLKIGIDKIRIGEQTASDADDQSGAEPNQRRRSQQPSRIFGPQNEPPPPRQDSGELVKAAFEQAISAMKALGSGSSNNEAWAAALKAKDEANQTLLRMLKDQEEKMGKAAGDNPLVDVVKDQMKRMDDLVAKLQERAATPPPPPPPPSNPEISVGGILKTFLENQSASARDAKETAERQAKESRELADRQSKEAREAAERLVKETREASERQAKESREAAERMVKEAREANDRSMQTMKEMMERERAAADERQKNQKDLFETMQKQQQPEAQLKVIQSFANVVGDSMAKSMEAQSKMMGTVGDMQSKMMDVVNKSLKKLAPDDDDESSGAPWKAFIQSLSPALEKSLDLVVHGVLAGQDPETAKAAYKDHMMKQALERANTIAKLPRAAQEALREEFMSKRQPVEMDDDEVDVAPTPPMPTRARPQKGGSLMSNVINETIQFYAEDILETLLPSIADDLDVSIPVSVFLGLEEPAMEGAMAIIGWSKVKEALLAAKTDAGAPKVSPEAAAILQGEKAGAYWAKCQAFLRSQIKARREAMQAIAAEQQPAK